MRRGKVLRDTGEKLSGEKLFGEKFSRDKLFGYQLLKKKLLGYTGIGSRGTCEKVIQ